MYITKSIKKYINDLSARQATPGGGSAAGLCGAMGAALLEMVCNFTLGNERYKDLEDDIKKYLVSLKKIRETFSLLLDKDVKVYSGIRRAFRTKDKKNIDKALKNGYYISLKICELSRIGMKIALDLAMKANVNLLTDVGCGAEFLNAGFNSGIFNAEINIRGIGKEFMKRESALLEALKKDIDILYKDTIKKTKEKVR